MKGLKVFNWINSKIRQYDFSLYGLMLLSSLSNAVFILVFLYIPKFIISLVTNNATTKEVVNVITLFGITIIISKFLVSFTEEYCNANYMRLRLKIIAEMGEKFMNRKYSDLESLEFLNASQKADIAVKGCSPGFEAAIKCLTKMGGDIATCICSLTAILFFKPLLVIFIVCIVLINRKLNQMNKIQKKELVDSMVATQRKSDYYFDLMSDFRYGKEVRIYKFSNWVMENFKIMCSSLRTSKNKISKISLNIRFIISLLSFIQLICVYVITTYSVLKGEIDIGSYLTYVGLISAFAAAMNGLMDDIIDFKYHCMYVNDLMIFFEMIEEEQENPQLSLKDIDMKNWCITFDNVFFRYPGIDRNVINNLSLTINKGDKIAITGLNGSGKTTMIKLLTRLYEPTEGNILLSGHNLREFSRKELYALFAPMFQDVFMFAFSVKENIALCPEDQIDTEIMLNKLSMVGLRDKIEALPNQLDTSCLNFLDLNGVQFSGGEQQKMILARTLYKDREIFIFDEPTAALDSISEDRIYSEFNNMTEGKTAIFITHRLASTKFCDTIYVFNNGRIVEKGTHESLLSQKGEYYELYSLQSKNYSIGDLAHV